MSQSKDETKESGKPAGLLSLLIPKSRSRSRSPAPNHAADPSSGGQVNEEKKENRRSGFFGRRKHSSARELEQGDVEKKQDKGKGKEKILPGAGPAPVQNPSLAAPPSCHKSPHGSGGNPGEDSLATKLWATAYEQLPDECKKKLDEEMKIDLQSATGKLQFLDGVLENAQQAQRNMEAKRWKIKWRNREIDLSLKADAIITWIDKFKQVGDIAVQYDPVHATLPWAGVRFILTVIAYPQLISSPFMFLFCFHIFSLFVRPELPFSI